MSLNIPNILERPNTYLLFIEQDESKMPINQIFLNLTECSIRELEMLFLNVSPSSMWNLSGNPNWRGRLSTIDLLLFNYVNQLIFMLKLLFIFLIKQATLMRKSFDY